MSRMRQSHILKTLRERFGGSFVCTPTNPISKLLGSMGFTSSHYPQLIAQLESMHTGGKLVVTWGEGREISSITLPGPTPPTPVDESETATMPAPKGQKAQLGRTRDDQVRPVQTHYASPEQEEVAEKAAKEVAEAGGLILEELGAIGHGALTGQEVNQLVMKFLKQLYSSAVTIQSMTRPVVEWLLDNGHMEKLPGKEATYRLVEPAKPVDEDVDELVRRLLAGMEEAQETEAALRREITHLTKELDSRISEARLNKILDDFEKARREVRRLNEENGKLKLEQERTAEQHNRALDAQRRQLEDAHDQETATLRKQLEEARNKSSELQRQVEQSGGGLSKETRARLRELGF